jgi:hypothetical protein
VAAQFAASQEGLSSVSNNNNNNNNNNTMLYEIEAEIMKT